MTSVSVRFCESTPSVKKEFLSFLDMFAFVYVSVDVVYYVPVSITPFTLEKFKAI